MKRLLKKKNKIILRFQSYRNDIIKINEMLIYLKIKNIITLLATKTTEKNFNNECINFFEN